MEVLTQLSRARMTSSNVTYESKWKLFVGFCKDRNLEPFDASPAQIAEFLLWVAKERKAAYSTLAGYRSALGQVFRLTTGYDPGTCPILSQLMQSFKRTQPTAAKRIPEWDIGLVLSVLNEKGNHNEKLSLEVLTSKVVFLLALASGDRVGALAALRFPPKFVDEEMTVCYDSEFVPKSYFVRKNVSRVSPLRVPYLDQQEFVQVCPCVTTEFYLCKTRELRSSVQSSLVIPTSGDRDRPMKSQMIAKHVVKLVRWCYEKLGVDSPKCRAHDVRKVAASLRALNSESLQEVLGAGSWSSPYTFLKHYFVPVQTHSGTAVSTYESVVAGHKTSVFCLQPERKQQPQ